MTSAIPGMFASLAILSGPWHGVVSYCMVVLASYDLGRCLFQFLTRLA